MAPDVTLQLAQFNAGIVALGTLVRLLVRVLVANMPHQLSRRREGRVTEFTRMRLCSGVSVDVIGETGHCLEAAFTDVALVRPTK